MAYVVIAVAMLEMFEQCFRDGVIGVGFMGYLCCELSSSELDWPPFNIIHPHQSNLEHDAVFIGILLSWHGTYSLFTVAVLDS